MTIRFLLILSLAVPLTVPAPAWQESVVNVLRDSTQRAPRIARDSAGNVLVVWTSQFDVQDRHRSVVVGRWIQPDGTPVGTETAFAPLSMPAPTGRHRYHGTQSQPALAMSPAGVAAVAWTQFDSTTWGDVFLRTVDKAWIGAGPIRVNETLGKTQSRPAVAISDAHIVAVVWDSWTDGDERDVFLRYFDALGNPRSPEMRVNQFLPNSQARPAVAFTSDSTVIVVWESWKQESASPFDPGTQPVSGYGVVARLMGPLGPRSDEVAVNAVTPDYQWQPDVVSFDDGSSFIVWCSWEQDGDDGSIVGRWFNADLAPAGPEVLINPTSRHYQWLPRVKKRGKDLAVVWSSWQQDGSREGVYGIFMDSSGYRRSFETRLNTRTESFQWEPDAIMNDDGSIKAVWADWGREGKDYEIVMADVMPVVPQGRLGPDAGSTASGRSTSSYLVHVLDSTALTGHVYEMRVAAAYPDSARINVVDVTSSTTVVAGFDLNMGEGADYRTPVFDGMSLSIRPEFDLELTGERLAVNISGFQASWSILTPGAGTPKLAPIDAAIVFGAPQDVLDTAINVSGQPVIMVPFRALNVTDGGKVELLVVENIVNSAWDPVDRIVLRTPPPYRTQVNHTFAEVRFAAGTTVNDMPVSGDTLFITTTKPLTTDDVYRFTGARSLVSAVSGPEPYPGTVRLYQNYPNPFNPVTAISFLLPSSGPVSLTVYDVLGREVRRLFDNEFLGAGYRSVQWDGRSDAGQPSASGLYIYVLAAGSTRHAGKMMLLK